MRKNVTILAMAVAAAFLTTPMASADWKAYGGIEPDNRYDSSSFMHTKTPAQYAAEGATKQKIYFNAYVQGDTVLGGGSYNPNNAVTGSQQPYAPSNYWHALLGFWADCNGDGYVGHLETAMREYRSELLSADQLAKCPAEHKAPVTVGPRTTGTLIIEFITIGREGLGVQDPYVVVDKDALVWGDEGLPFPLPGAVEFSTPQAAPSSCGALTGGPKGSYDNVGGVLNNAECSTGRAGVPVWNAVVPGILGSSYAFTDDSYDQPGHPVGDVDTFGRDDDRKNTMVAWADCSQGPLVNLGLVMGSDRQGHGPRPPRSSPDTSKATQRNVAATYNDTYESAVQNCKTKAEGDTSGDYDREFYDTFEGSSGNSGSKEFKGKTNADYNLAYREMSRGAVPCGPPTRSQDCGISALSGIIGSSTALRNSFWSAKEPIGTFVLSTFATRDLAQGRLTNASFFTFYASVGSASTAVGDLPGGSGEYGSAFCGAGGYDQTGATQYHYGWNCNKAQWNTGGDGTIQFTQAYPGLGYNLRDVDCFDGTLVKGTPLTVSPQKFSATPCWSDDLPL